MKELSRDERFRGEGRPAALEPAIDTPGHGLNAVPSTEAKQDEPKGWKLTGPVSTLSEDALG